MIYYLTGQPGSGKTTLGKELKAYIEKFYPTYKVIHIDGDQLREIFDNKKFTREGRIANMRIAHDIAKFLNYNGYTVIISLVAPYREIREELKKSGNMIEIFVHCNEIRGKEQYYAMDYEQPIKNYIDINTTDSLISNSLNQIIYRAELH